MSTSAIYEVIDALVDQLTSELDVPVYDGYPDTDDPGLTYLAVGIPDPSDESAANSASSVQQWAHANHTARDESGDVRCVVVATSPEGVQRDARASAKAVTEAVEDYLRDNYTLDVPTLLWTGYGTDTDLQQDLTDQGAVALVVFSISFRARI